MTTREILCQGKYDVRSYQAVGIQHRKHLQVKSTELEQQKEECCAKNLFSIYQILLLTNAILSIMVIISEEVPNDLHRGMGRIEKICALY